MILDFIRSILYIILAIVAFYFMMANLSLIKPNPTVIHSGGNSHAIRPPTAFPNQDEIERELSLYSQELINRTSPHSELLGDNIKNQIRFKQEKANEEEANSGIINNFLKSFASVPDKVIKAPDLENYEDYAPTEMNMPGGNNQCHSGQRRPILPNNKIVPNFLEINKSVAPVNGGSPSSGPIAINEFDTQMNPDFQSERTNNYNDRMPSDGINNFFKNNPAKFFDNLSKADVTDPAQWDQIAKKKEQSSPLLGLSCMKVDEQGYMPGNHYNKDFASSLDWSV
jgi:hypothetical protein